MRRYWTNACKTPAQSRNNAPTAKNAASRDGSMSTFPKPCSSGWIKILRLTASMRRVHPYHGENSGPGKDVRGELDTQSRN